MRSKHFFAVLLSTLLLVTMSVTAFAQRQPLERTEVGNIVIEPIITQNDEPLREPTSLDFAADGTIFFIERLGFVNQLDPYTGERIELLELDVFTVKPGGERELGLLGIALEPGFDFEEKNKIWLYYSPNPENNVMNRLSRFEYKIGEDGVPYIDPASEELIFMVYWDRDWCCHPAGDLRFAPDGTLFLSLGDDVNPSGTHGGYGGLDTRPGNEQFSALRTAQSATDLRGKILRLNPDGTIPTDNPFYNDSRFHPAVYAAGFRNPYRFAIDPVTGWIVVGDNDPDARTVDPERGPAATSEWNIITEPGQNFGWPYCVGANEPYMDYDYFTGTNNGPHDCTEMQPAYVAIEKSLMWQYPEVGQGGSSPIGGVILRRPAEDAKYQWSADLLNHWYPANFSRGHIVKIDLLDAGTRMVEPSDWYDYNLQAPRDYHQVPPTNASINMWLDVFSGPIDLRQSPDGALYLVDYGSGFFRANPEAAIYRIYDKAATQGQETVNLGVQVYALAGSLEERLAIAAAAGYKGVELTGTHNLTADEMNALLDKYNLVVASNHWRGWDDLEAAAEFNLAIGNTRIVNPMERADSAEGWREIGRELNRIGAELREYGISFGYHNHAHEFEIFDGKYAIEYLFEETDPENVHFQIDLGWAYEGGADLLELIDKYAGRIESVHVKDWSGDSQVSVGHGDISWPAVLHKLNTVGGTKWFIAEQDRPENATLFAFESAAFLNPLLAQILDKAEHKAPYADLPSAVQLYAIRQAPGGFEGRLALAADAGYNAVELWGWGNLTGGEVRALLDKYGLDATSTHTGANDLRNNMQSTIQFHQAAGVDRLIVPSFNANDAEGWANFGKEMNAWGAELREHGIALGYHNHGQEFREYDGRYALEWMLDEIDPENVFLQVDLGWAYDAGVDLIELINTYPGRILSVHVKDWNADGSSQVSVGKGVIDWVEVLSAAREIGGTEWFITEQDGPPSFEAFAYESAVGLNAVLNEILQ